jgi:dTDP-D-glucose 4,6-dehydratase
MEKLNGLSSNMINSFGTKKYSEKLVRNTMYTISYMSRVYVYGVDLNDDELQTLPWVGL